MLLAQIFFVIRHISWSIIGARIKSLKCPIGSELQKVSLQHLVTWAEWVFVASLQYTVLTFLKTTTSGTFTSALWSDFSSSTAPHFYGVTARANKHTFCLCFMWKSKRQANLWVLLGDLWLSFGNEHQVMNYFSSTGQTIELHDSCKHTQ